MPTDDMPATDFASDGLSRPDLYTTFAAAQPALNQIIIADLMHLRLLQFSGHDSQRFLQGQLSCDVTEVNESNTRLAAHCNLQGRVFALGRLLKFQDSFYWHLPSGIAAASLANLKKYALFSKVTVQGLPPEPMRAFGIAGAAAESSLTKFGLSYPPASNSIASQHNIFVVREFGALPRFTLYGEPTALSAIWQTLAQDHPKVEAETWRCLDVAAGQSFLETASQGLFLPQELHLDKLDAVSFTKGCYLGQEVIARLHYLGKLKKHLWQIELSQAQTPGSKLFQADRAVGQLVCHANFSGKNFGLAVIQNDISSEFKFSDGSLGRKIATVMP